MTATSKCPHMNFHANVEIARIEDTGLKYAHLTIVCSDCGAPAQFRGLDWVMSEILTRAGALAALEPGEQLDEEYSPI